MLNRYATNAFAFRSFTPLLYIVHTQSLKSKNVQRHTHLLVLPPWNLLCKSCSRSIKAFLSSLLGDDASAIFYPSVDWNEWVISGQKIGHAAFLQNYAINIKVRRWWWFPRCLLLHKQCESRASCLKKSYLANVKPGTTTYDSWYQNYCRSTMGETHHPTHRTMDRYDDII